MGWLDWLVVRPCPLCQRPPQQGCFCGDCARQLQALRHPALSSDPLPVFAWGRYDGHLRRAIRILKYEGQPRIGRTLGSWLGQAWGQSGGNRTLTLVPIPLHAERLRQRGYNQAELISREFSALAGMPHQPKALERVKSTQAQYGLTKLQRQQNLESAFRVAQVPASPVLLVDDIYTTGSTIAAACRALATAGVPVAGVAVVGRALPGSQLDTGIRV